MEVKGLYYSVAPDFWKHDYWKSSLWTFFIKAIFMYEQWIILCISNHLCKNYIYIHIYIYIYIYKHILIKEGRKCGSYEACFSYFMPIFIPLHCCYLFLMHKVNPQWRVLSISRHFLCLCEGWGAICTEICECGFGSC
jgi:hypothetical protein